jgi:hypothetical protein
MRLQRCGLLTLAACLALGCQPRAADDAVGTDTPAVGPGAAVPGTDPGHPVIAPAPDTLPGVPPRAPGQTPVPPRPGEEPPAAADPRAAGAVLSGNREQDERTLRRLEREARQLARRDGCRNDAQCAAAPLGAKACGGPREYVTYCTLTTDTEALRARLNELSAFEQAYNLRYEIVSDCMLVMEPPVGVTGGSCVARQ